MDTNRNITNQSISSKLGCLFYSVAAADGKVKLCEIHDLHTAMSGMWLAGNAAGISKKIIFNTFNDLQNAGTKPEEAFAEFKTYYLKHKHSFDTKLKSNITKIAAAIAAAFAGNNKSELTYLAQLYFLLK